MNSWRWTCFFTRLATKVVSVVTLCVFCLIVWLSYKPYTLDHLPTYVQRILQDQGLQLVSDGITLSFDKRFVLRVENARLLTLSNRVVAKLSEGEVSFANRFLARGKIRPKHVRLDGLVTHIHIDEGGVKVGPQFLARFDDTPADSKSADVIELLDRLSGGGFAQALRTVRIQNFFALAEDKKAGVTWLFQDGAVVLTRYDDDGESLTVTGMVRQKEVQKTVPIIGRAFHAIDGEKVELSLSFQNSTTDLIAPYIPHALKSILKTQGDIEIGTRLGRGNIVEEPWFTFRLGETEVRPTGVYTHPLKFKNIELVGRYYALPRDELIVQSLQVVDDQGHSFQVSGTVAALENTPTFDISLVTDLDTLDDVQHYLPDAILPNTTRWLKAHTRDVSISNLVGSYKGQPVDMPKCSKECGLEFQADIAKGQVKFMDRFQWADVDDARFTLKENYVRVLATQGKWVGQDMKNVDVSIHGLFEPGIDNELRVIGDAEGSLGSLLDELRHMLKVDEIPYAQGHHVSQMDLRIPLFDNPNRKASAQDLNLDIDSKISNIKLPIPVGDSQFFTAEQGDLKFNERIMTLKADGSLFGFDINADYMLDIGKPNDSERLIVKSWLSPSAVQQHLGEFVQNVEGQGKLLLTLKRESDTVRRLEADVDLTPMVFRSDKLNWQKPAKQSFKVTAEGTLGFGKNDSAELNLDLLTATGEHTEIAGSFYLKPNTVPSFQFTPFKLGQHDFSIQSSHAQLEIIGKYLDARGVDLLANQEKSELPKSFSVLVDLAQADLKDGLVTGLNIQAERKNGRWEEAQVKGAVEAAPFELTLTPLPGARQFRVIANNAGALWKTLMGSNLIRRGQLQGDLTLADDDTGQGFVLVQNSRWDDVPVLVKLLNLLSLDALLDANEGVKFDAVKIPLRVDKRVVHIHKAELDGPAMDMRLNGYYNLDGQINLDGRLIPAVAFNRTISKIPLVGDILAGSQEGVVVADFKIKGLSQNPKVEVKPLSVVTPGLLKDIFGIFD